MTLSRLYIRIKYTYFLECLIEHIPALKQLSVEFNKTLNIYPRSELLIENLCQSNGNWYNKLPNLRHFTLKTFILNDVQFVYLKWLLNNLNHVQKLKLRLGSENLCRTDQIIWKSYIDANFVQQYCLPDIINNIIDFDFYICFYCQLLSIDVEKVINSFRYHSLFINRQWTNIKCFYDPIVSYQHLFSTNINMTLQTFNGLVNEPYVFQWPNIHHISIDFNPSLYIFLKQLDETFPNVSSITVYMEYYKSFDEADAFNQLKTNALSSVQYVEFSISSCHRNSNESANIGKHLVPFLKLHMPHLQTLRLWRPDDFPWTTESSLSNSPSKLVDRTKDYDSEDDNDENNYQEEDSNLEIFDDEYSISSNITDDEEEGYVIASDLSNTERQNFSGCRIYDKVNQQQINKCFRIRVGTSLKYIHKQTACWLLTK
ncbi:unnamed protein product, partial [Rotaria sordida]